MRYLIILPLFFLSGFSYSTPDCETLKQKEDKAHADRDKAHADWYKADVDRNKAHADRNKAEAAYKQCG